MRLGLGLLALLLAAPSAFAWPAELMELLSRDARRMVPRTLSRLLSEREDAMYDAVRRFPPELSQALAHDLNAGRLRPETVAALDRHTDQVRRLMAERRISEALVQLGGLLRVPADLADPVLGAGARGYPPGVAREYYEFISASLDKIPVVLRDRSALELPLAELPRYWQGLMDESRPQAGVIRTELFQRGAVVDHRRIDYRNPVFGVASLAWSRAATGIAATWLAVWRDVQGDLTRMPQPRTVRPGPDEAEGR